MAVSKKFRVWWFVQKIENLPEDWRDLLVVLALPCCYIVHDKDEATEPHVHCMLEFGSQVRPETVLQTIPESFGVKYVEPVPSKVGAYRYLMHAGQDGKHHYDRDEIVHLAGFKVNLSDVYNVDFRDIYDLIEGMQIPSFSGLVAFVCEFKPEYLSWITSHSVMVRSYMAERFR